MGGGYPKGLRGDEIPICAQVTALADVYDALTTDRVYKEKYPHTQAVNMILNRECGVFSPKLLECFKNVTDQFAELAEAMGDNISAVDDDFTAPLPGPDQTMPRTDTLHRVQMKYQTLLHYIDATVLEVDLNNGSYHIVFNPNVQFSFLTGENSFNDAVNAMIESVIHDDDKAQTRLFFRNCHHAFYEQGLRKYSCRSRIYYPVAGRYEVCDFTLLQIGNDASSQGSVLLLICPAAESPSLPPPEMPAADMGDMLYGLVGSAICCLYDNAFTILEGAENLFSLTGYMKDEIESCFDSSLLQLVIPEDRDYLNHQLDEQMSHGDFVETEYRLRKKDGGTVWILARSRLTTGPDGMERIYSVLNNNTRVRTSQEQLQLLLERNEIIMDQTDDIIFEWDIARDYLTCSSKWELRFGYGIAPENFSQNLFRQPYLHPDDLNLIANGMTRLRNGTSYLETECRIINSSGRYTWNRLRATLQRDENGNPARVIGVIVDIDSSKRVAQNLQEKADRDSLTGLLNREASRQKISSSLNHDEKLLSALLMIDLDNFKAVNDTYGHLFGDAVLTRTAEEIRKLFRNNDVISRIGGDEFMVFIAAIPDKNLVESRCKLLVENLRSMFAEMIPNTFTSCSIGASLCPIHGDSYLELYQKADQALYYAKSHGKNGYAIYDDNLASSSLGLNTTITARIDSDEQPGVNTNSLVKSVFELMYHSHDLYEILPKILGEVGRAINVSRVYIFENNENNTACSNTFEWCNEGILPEIDNLQDMSYLRGPIQGWDQNYLHSDVFYCADVSKLPDSYRNVLEAQNVKSLLHCTIRDNGQFRGFIGFDECSATRLWTQDQIDLLTFLSHMVSMFLLKKRSQEKYSILSENLRNVLDSQNAWIYVVDAETSRIQYANQQTRSLSPRIEEGARCYEVLRNRQSRCPDCPSYNMDGVQKRGNFIFNQYFGINVRCEASKIQWNGRDAHLLSCYPLKD